MSGSILYFYSNHLGCTISEGDTYWSIEDNQPKENILTEIYQGNEIENSIVFLTEDDCKEFIKDKCME